MTSQMSICTVASHTGNQNEILRFW